MILLNTFAFVLALLALSAAAAALLICYRHGKGMDSLKSSNAQLLKAHAASIERSKQVISERLAELDRRSPSKLSAEVAELSEAVARLRVTHLKFAGRFDQYVGQREAQPSLPGVPNGALDPELAAELALQSAPAAAPGSR